MIMKITQRILTALCLVLAGCMVSCGSDTSDTIVLDSGTSQESSNYTQVEITPIETTDATITSFTSNENGQSLLNLYEATTGTPYAFVYSNGTWKEQDNEAMIQILEEYPHEEVTVICDYNGTWWVFLQNQGCYQNIIQVEIDGTRTVTEVSQFTSVNQVFMGEDGVLCVQTIEGETGSILLIDTTTGEFINHRIPSNVQAYYTTSSELYATIDNETIALFGLETGEMLEEYEVTTGNLRDAVYIREEAFVTASDEGIIDTSLIDSTIQTVIDQKSYAYADPRIESKSYVVKNVKDGSYLMAAVLDGSVKVYEYGESDEMAQEVEMTDELIIWAFKEDAYINDMVALYAQQYPNCQIILEYSTYSDAEGAQVTYDDAIRKLNAELLAGDAPDVLFLDGLPINSLYNQGMLSTIELTIDESEYYENILHTYTDENGTYAYPTAVNLFVFVTNSDIVDAESYNTLEGIAQLYQDPTAIQMESESGIFHVFYYTTYHNIFPDESTVNEEALTQLLVESQKMVASSNENRSLSGGFRWDMSDSHATILANPLGASYLFLNQDDVSVMPLLDGVYMSKNIASIPVDAVNQENAKVFIQMLLEDEVGQSVNAINRYFSVRKGADAQSIENFLDGYVIEDASNTDYVQDYLGYDWDSLMEGMEYSCEEDYIVKEIVYEEALQYYSNPSEDVSLVVARIMNKLQIILAERN